MSVPSLNGPNSLTSAVLNNLYTSLNVGGVYVLARSTNSGSVKQYVGRTNNQTLYDRLSDHVNDGIYEKFWYAGISLLEDRFDGECELYHQYPNENVRHPERPPGESWKCPRCNIFG